MCLVLRANADVCASIHKKTVLTISMMSKELRTYRTYASFIKCFLFIGGVCPHAIERSIIYRYVSLWSILPCFISIYSVGNYCLQNVTNVRVLTASLSLLATMLNTTVKGCSFFIYQKKLRQVNDILNSLLGEAFSEASARLLIFSCLRSFCRLIYIQTFLMMMTTLFYVSKPLFTMNSYNAENVTGIHYPLPLPANYPWMINSSLLWKLHYIFETCSCWFAFVISTAVDGFFGFCMYRLSVILRLLAFEFGTKFSGVTNDIDCRKVFRGCVDKHNLLIICRDIVQEVYGPIILLATVANAVGMCTLIFQALQVGEVTVSKGALIAVFFCMKLLQTFLYAWTGDVVITESEFFHREISSNGWFECNDTRFAKHFLLVLKQRPLILKACDLLQVSLDLFAKVVHTAISYYFLLETMDSDTA